MDIIIILAVTIPVTITVISIIRIIIVVTRFDDDHLEHCAELEASHD